MGWCVLVSVVERYMGWGVLVSVVERYMGVGCPSKRCGALQGVGVSLAIVTFVIKKVFCSFRC